MIDNLYALAKQLGDLCFARHVTLALAESCTGGLVSSLITEVAGSSAWFQGAAIVYSNEAKENILEVSPDILRQYGAISEQTAKAMASGALKKFHADFALSITGIAGPLGGTKEKPVGTVCFGLADKKTLPIAKTQQFASGRDAIRHSAVIVAFEWMSEFLRSSP